MTGDLRQHVAARLAGGLEENHSLTLRTHRTVGLIGGEQGEVFVLARLAGETEGRAIGFVFDAADAPAKIGVGACLGFADDEYGITIAFAVDRDVNLRLDLAIGA